MTGQERLNNAKAACIGAGGLGSPALMYLAAAGVGTLGIVEFDTVDDANLTPQPIHAKADIGRSKARAPRLDVDNVKEIFAQYDLIRACGDFIATSPLVIDAPVLLGKPYVWGSIY